MAKNYSSEMEKLDETFSWACSVNIDQLRQVVRAAGLSPLIAIGSGGSLTAAHALASLHQRYTRRIASVCTPLEASSEQLDNGLTTWLISAGGGNVDILRVAKELISCEPRQIVVLCGREDSPLARICKEHPFVDLISYHMPAGKDGFLATNSLLAFSILLSRAYCAEYSEEAEWAQVVKEIQRLLCDESEDIATWKSTTAGLWERPTTLVIHGATTRIGAVDLESKFTEAALGNLQIADYRNFAHGRHHWLAKRGEISAVIGFISDYERVLAERTLALIPSDIPQAKIKFTGSAPAVALASLIAALRITGWAGIARNIDPGRPGVPEFGRKLYNMRVPSKSRKKQAIKGLSERDSAAITRKAGQPIKYIETAGNLSRWRSALESFRERLHNVSFTSLVLDYDGTIVDPRHRFEIAREEMAAELIRLLDSGIYIGIATGRGISIRHDLRALLPSTLWPRVLLGYYNGAEVARLQDDTAPDGRDITCEVLGPIAEALQAQPELAEAVEQTNRRFQITLQAKRMMPENRLWALVYQTILLTKQRDVVVTRSSHSIDILAPQVSKLNVLKKIREATGDMPILTIGDRGRWPGNDHELLREPFALSVDEVSVDPETCWNLAPCGQRGVAVTLDYLKALDPHDSILRFRRNSLK